MRFPGSFRGDSDYDLTGPNRRLEQMRNRIEDNFSGDESEWQAINEAKGTAAEQRRAAHRARAAQRPTLSEHIRGWWTRRSSRGT